MSHQTATELARVEDLLTETFDILVLPLVREERDQRAKPFERWTLRVAVDGRTHACEAAILQL